VTLLHRWSKVVDNFQVEQFADLVGGIPHDIRKLIDPNVEPALLGSRYRVRQDRKHSCLVETNRDSFFERAA